jgi:EmrB/QacA subfamily drug resistance transporter
VQGLLGGILPAVTLTILLRIVPGERLGAAVGLYGLGAMVAPAIGPALGGYLVEYVNWRLIFFINIPVGIIGTVAAVLVLPVFPAGPGRRLDVLGFVTVASAMFALLLALSKAEDWHWTSYRILGLLAFSLVSLALFVVIELAVEEPLLDLRVFRYAVYTQSLLLTISLAGVLFAVLFYVPQFLQQVQGLGAFDAGLALLPPALLMGLLMPLTGRIADRIGPRAPAVVGLMIATLGTYLLHTISIDTSREHIIWYLTVLYVGLGIGMMPITSAGLGVIPPAQVNAASAFTNVVQRTAGALGVAVFTAIVTVQRAQLMGGRAALLSADTPIPHLGADTPHWLDVYAVYQQADLQVYADAIDNLFLLASVITAVTALGGFLLRSASSHG